MKTQHTPGPWQAHIDRWPNGKLNGVPYVYAPNGINCHRHVCEPCFDESASQEIQAMQEANARLIAAAPELLAALEAMFNAASVFKYDFPAIPADEWATEGNKYEAWIKARAAIAKATTNP